METGREGGRERRQVSKLICGLRLNVDKRKAEQANNKRDNHKPQTPTPKYD